MPVFVRQVLLLLCLMLGAAAPSHAQQQAASFVLQGLNIGADWKLASLDLPPMKIQGTGPDYLAESDEFPVEGSTGAVTGLLRVLLRDIEGVQRIRRVSLVMRFAPPVKPAEVEQFFVSRYGTPGLRHAPRGDGDDIEEQLHLLWGQGCLRNFRPIPLAGEVLYARIFPGEQVRGEVIAFADLRDMLGPFMAEEVPPPGEAPC